MPRVQMEIEKRIVNEDSKLTEKNIKTKQDHKYANDLCSTM